MKQLFFLIIPLLFIGCSTQVSLHDYPYNIQNTAYIPNACKKEYTTLMSPPKVAILRFSNYSSFGVAKVSTKNKNNSFNLNILGSIFSHGRVGGINAQNKSNKNLTTRVVEPKLDKAITSSLEGVLAQMGGVNIYSRDDLAKVIKEQKLENSGLFDENSIVALGKLTGVKYIITGSIDGVTQEYKDYTQLAKIASAITTQNSKKKNLTKTLAKIYAINLSAQAMSGMKITTIITFKVIDAQTGEILFSQQAKETKNIGNFPHPSYSQIIGAIKFDINQAIKTIKPKFSQFFAPKGYILQVKTDKKHKNFIAQINLGSNQHIKPEQQFNVYQLNTIIDPVTGKETCDKSTMDVILTISKNQLQANRSWAIASGDDVKDLRPGQIVKRKKLKNSFLSF